MLFALCTPIIIVLACAQAILGSPLTLGRRAVSRVHILRATNPPTLPDGCTIDQQKALITTMVAEAQAMTQNSIRALRLPNAEKSSAFVAMFGREVSAAEISARHFEPILPLLSAIANPLVVANKLGETKDTLLLTCSQDQAKQAFASTSNFFKGSAKGGKDNRIAFHPQAFANTDTLEAIAAQFQATGQFRSPPLGLTLIHEAQHSIPIVGKADRAKDQPIWVPNPKAGSSRTEPQQIQVPAYGLQQVQYRLTPAEKLANAQNYAYFALLATIRPDLVQDDCGRLFQQIGKPNPENAPLREPLPDSPHTSPPRTPSPRVGQCDVPGAGFPFLDIDEDEQPVA